MDLVVQRARFVTRIVLALHMQVRNVIALKVLGLQGSQNVRGAQLFCGRCELRDERIERTITSSVCTSPKSQIQIAQKLEISCQSVAWRNRFIVHCNLPPKSKAAFEGIRRRRSPRQEIVFCEWSVEQRGTHGNLQASERIANLRGPLLRLHAA